MERHNTYVDTDTHNTKITDTQELHKSHTKVHKYIIRVKRQPTQWEKISA